VRGEEIEVVGELDKNMDDSREWVNEVLCWFFPSAEPLAKQARAESLVEVLADLRFTIHAWLRWQFKHEDRIKELEKWRAVTDGHIGEMNYTVGVLHERVGRLVGAVENIRFAGAEVVADAVLEVGRMKVEVAGLKSIISNVKDRLRSVESKFPQHDGYDDPSHSFFSED